MLCTICNKIINAQSPTLFSGKEIVCMSCQIDKVADELNVDRQGAERKSILLGVIDEGRLIHDRNFAQRIMIARKKVLKGTIIEFHGKEFN